MWTLPEGTQSAEDLRGQSQQEELRGDGGAKGEARRGRHRGFSLSLFSLSRESESCSSVVIIAVVIRA